MKPLIVLILTFFTALVAIKLLKGIYAYALAARIAMAGMLFFTAVGHFVFTEGMALMLPAFIPHKQVIVLLSGVIEITAAIGLLVPGLRAITGWLLIIFFILILPANIYAAMHRVDFQTPSLEGPGPDYLWFRVPLQFFFIAWVYLSSIR